MPEKHRCFDLRCEFLKEPLAIGCDDPRLTWKVEGCERVDAYQIQSASSEALLYANCPDLWDSGDVGVSGLLGVHYAGRPLKSCDRAYWRVRSFADSEWSDWSAVSFWERAIVDTKEWAAQWIWAVPENVSGPAPATYLRNEFEMPGKGVIRARLHYSAKGLIRVHLNDADVTEGRLDPGWTDYRHRIMYRAVDVTGALHCGRNKVLAILGDGWYCGNICWFGRKRYGPHPMALIRLLIDFEDGTSLVIGSDSSWAGSQGNIRFNDLIGGETQNLDMGKTETPLLRVESAAIGGESLVPANCPPVRMTEVLHPVKSWWSEHGTRMFDFGQNHTGVLSLEITGPSELTVTHGEALDIDGNLYTANLRSAQQTDSVRLSRGHEVWEPAFTFHGYRYAEVAGLPEDSLPRVESHVLHTDLERTGWFECGHPGLNQLFSNIVWSLRSNFVDIPTDCPQRDERLGWLGDAQVFAPTAAYLYDVSTFFAKWMPDVVSGMSERGIFPNVAPQLDELTEGAPGWADAGVIVPWTMYEFYADERLLASCFLAMKRYCETVFRANPDGIWRNLRSHDFGDWLSIGEETDQTLLATAFLGRSLQLTAQTARVLGREADFVDLSSKHSYVWNAFKREYPLESIATQTGLVLAAQSFDLDEAQWRIVGDRLEHQIKANGGKLATGFLGVAGLLETLVSTGRDRLAMDLLLSREFPGWLFPIDNGATTIWERWDGWTPEAGFQDPGMNSFNHYCFGSVGAFFFERLGGIKRLGPAFSSIALVPVVDERLSYIDVRFDSRFGQIRSRWGLEGDSFAWEIQIPSGCQAKARIPRAAVDLASWRAEGAATEVDENGSTRAFRLRAGKTVIKGPVRLDVG